MSAVRRVGIAAPEVRDVIMVDRRPALVMERVSGLSVWQHIINSPHQTSKWAAMLASAHLNLLSREAPPDVPSFVGKTAARIDLASQLSSAQRAEAFALLRSLPDGNRVLHGDLHPGNVIVGPNGPVIIDWFDASAGNPVADIIRSSIMMRPSPGISELPHLAGSSNEVLNELRRSYLSYVKKHVESERPLQRLWEAVIAVARLSEGLEYHTVEMLEMWHRRHCS